MNSSGIHDIAYKSVMGCSEEIRNRMFANIVLSGGCTLFRGFGERLFREIASLLSNEVEVRVLSPENRQHSAWNGGSALASLSSCKHMWATKEEYAEFGPPIVRRKCF